MSRTKYVSRVNIGLEPEIDHALATFDEGIPTGMSLVTGGTKFEMRTTAKEARKWVLRSALNEAVLAMADYRERNGNIPLGFRFEVVLQPRRQIDAAKAFKETEAQIDAALEQATKAAEGEA